MILSVDVMGFENNVSEAINGCRVFLKHHKNCEIILVGDEKLIKDLIKPGEKFTIVHTNEFIKQTDNPIAVIRNKNTSMYKAIELAANGKADGVLSAGNTGAYVSLCFLLLKTIEGVNKPAFMPYLPTINKKGLVLLDCGANTQCNGEDLYQFGVMGSLYCKLIRNIKNPKIGVINIGTEDKKGFEYHHKANELFKADKKLNYTGFVETRELLNGEVDV
jgi:glycerol-3-phosphate acyltransferase PlsX